MTSAARKLLETVLALPEDERLELAEEIMASVDGPADAAWEAEWRAELDRRVAAGETDPNRTSDWSEVRERIARRLGHP